MAEELIDDPVEALMAPLLELSAQRRAAALDALCAEHPGEAAELRRRMAALEWLGLEDATGAGGRPLALRTGDQISHFSILGSIGSGGMGQVYRARDTRLEREVAIKVMPPDLATDPVRLRRFEREARALAALSHPNIAQIHGIDAAQGQSFLVLELVAGEDLADRLRRGPLAVVEAMEVSRQIALGLEAAHEAGVMHRDLKPSNVRITPAGVVKLLDFGLAKSVLSAAPGMGELTPRPDSVALTRDGFFLGTPVYMSPEQARGKAVDRRTDIWAFGCVLFECLTGQRAFSGDNLGDLTVAILNQEPDWSLLPAAVPEAVVALLHRCLEKDPLRRLRDMGEARLVLADAHLGSAAARRLHPAPARRRELVGWIIAGGAGIAALLAWNLQSGRGEREMVPTRLSVYLGQGEDLVSNTYTNLALSADGRRLTWIGGKEGRIMVRSLDDFTVRALAGTEGSSSPFFSPDGEWIGFFQGDSLQRIPAAGGIPEVVVREHDFSAQIEFYETENRGGTWTEDGWIVFCPSIRDGLYRVRPTGGPIERITQIAEASGERTHRWPRALPGGQGVLFVSDDRRTPEQYDDASIMVVVPGTQQRKLLLAGASEACYTDGALVFARGGALYVQAFDLDALALRGPEIHLLDGVERDVSSGGAQFALAASGTLAFAPVRSQDKALRLVWRGLGGATEALNLPPGAYAEPALSPDGQSVAFVVADAGTTDIWIHSLERGTVRRLTRSGSNFAPVWSRDGGRIAYLSRFPPGLHLRPADGSGQAEVLIETGEDWAAPCFFTPDGSGLVLDWRRQGTRNDLVRLDLGTRRTTDLVATDAAEQHPALAPDGEWLAFTSDSSGVAEVYVRSLSRGTGWWQVSSEGGSEPCWSADGLTLYYLRGPEEQLWAVSFASGAEPGLGAPRLVMNDFCYYSALDRRHYVLAPGGRFLTLLAADEQRELGREIRVLSGWKPALLRPLPGG